MDSKYFVKDKLSVIENYREIKILGNQNASILLFLTF